MKKIMAYRLIYSEFWTDPFMQEDMTPEDKYFYLYILTNPNTTMAGIYTITKKQISFELGYSIESVNSLIDRFENHHKLLKYNKETRELAIKNWGKHNLNKGGKPVIDCLKKEFNSIKDKSLIAYVGVYVKSEVLKKIYDSYNVSCNDSSNDTGAIQNTEYRIQIQNTEYNSSSSENSNEEEELLEIMRICQKLNFKLKKIDAKDFIDLYSINKVKQALITISKSQKFLNKQIKSPSAYLAATLQDLGRDKKVDVTINKAKNKFVDYDQRPNMTKEEEEELLWLPGERL